MKIIDFGFARLRPQSPAGPMQTPCFTLQYAAPELLAQQGYDEIGRASCRERVSSPV